MFDRWTLQKHRSGIWLVLLAPCAWQHKTMIRSKYCTCVIDWLPYSILVAMVCLVTLLVFLGCPKFIEVLMQKLNDEKTSVEPCCKIDQNGVINVFVGRWCWMLCPAPLPPVPSFISVPDACMHLHYPMLCSMGLMTDSYGHYVAFFGRCNFLGCT